MARRLQPWWSLLSHYYIHPPPPLSKRFRRPWRVYFGFRREITNIMLFIVWGSACIKKGFVMAFHLIQELESIRAWHVLILYWQLTGWLPDWLIAIQCVIKNVIIFTRQWRKTKAMNGSPKCKKERPGLKQQKPPKTHPNKINFTSNSFFSLLLFFCLSMTNFYFKQLCF